MLIYNHNYMKMYATTTSERASKGQGGNDQLDISLAIGSTANSKQVLRILARVLPKEASISDKESVVIMIMKENDEGHIQELTGRLVYSLPSCVEIHTREQALHLKGEQPRPTIESLKKQAIKLGLMSETPMSDKTDDREIDYNIEQEKGEKQKGEKLHICQTTGAILKHCPTCGSN